MTIEIIFSVVFIILLIAFVIFSSFVEAPNAIALPVQNRALSPRTASLFSSVCTMYGAFLAGVTGYYFQSFLPSMPPGTIGLSILIAALLTSVLWQVLGLFLKYPSSANHTMILALSGALLASQIFAHESGQIFNLTLWFTLLPLIVFPTLAFFTAYFLVSFLKKLVYNWTPSQVTTRFQKSQILMTTLISFGQGIQAGIRCFSVAFLAFLVLNLGTSRILPWPLIFIGVLLIGVGNFGGAWVIAQTMVRHLITLDVLRGFSASASSALYILGTTILPNIPVFPSYLGTTSILGAGTNQRYSTIKPKKVFRMLLFWLLTIPACFILSFLLFLALSPMANIN